MSYARFGWDSSDVYIYSSWLGQKSVIVCAMCYFGDDLEPSYYAESTLEMLEHLKAHERAGQTVPPDTYTSLLSDDPLNFPSKSDSDSA